MSVGALPQALLGGAYSASSGFLAGFQGPFKRRKWKRRMERDEGEGIKGGEISPLQYVPQSWREIDAYGHNVPIFSFKINC